MFILEKKAKGYLRNLRTVCKKISKLSQEGSGRHRLWGNPRAEPASIKEEILQGNFTCMKGRLAPSYHCLQMNNSNCE